MKTTLLPASTFKTNVWGGGTTTELFIYPPAAKYALRDFDFRLSSATVEVEKSVFTPLPGYRRKLMVLDGATKLVHENQHEILLKKFDVDAFEGDWKTTSAGKCTDFNLMTCGNFSGEIAARELEKNQSTAVNIPKNAVWFFVYVFRGEVSFSINSEVFSAHKGDVILIENPEDSKFTALSSTKTELVFSAIHVF